MGLCEWRYRYSWTRTVRGNGVSGVDRKQRRQAGNGLALDDAGFHQQGLDGITPPLDSSDQRLHGASGKVLDRDFASGELRMG